MNKWMIWEFGGFPIFLETPTSMFFFEKSEKSYSTVSGLACLPKNMVPMRLILANGSTY